MMVYASRTPQNDNEGSGNMRNLLVGVVLLALFPALVLKEGLGQAQPDGITVTILFDNYPAKEGLRTGWGFAALLETPDHTVLFDTGNEGESFMENLSALGKDPSAIESVVISHAHGDHTGGLQALLETGIRPNIFVLSAFAEAARSLVPEGIELIEAEPGQVVAPGIRSTGLLGVEIPEQALFLQTSSGAVVLTGCAHPGVVAMAEKAQALGSGPLHAIVGGFHLMEATDAELEGIMARFREMGVQKAGPTHCSGDHTMEVFREAYGADFLELGSGQVLRFGSEG
jgi:7,8-dihydropterin-6-yl-methyl-4-(beta-D-ribofuranosyl)aminobenzene 5'-phosphate synthase